MPRVEQRTDLDRLVIELETNGTIDPEEAIREKQQRFCSSKLPYLLTLKRKLPQNLLRKKRS